LSGLRIPEPKSTAEIPAAFHQEIMDFEDTSPIEAPESKEKEFPERKESASAKTQEFEVVTSVRKTSEFFRPLAEPPVKEQTSKGRHIPGKPVKEKPPANEDVSARFEKPAAEAAAPQEDE